MHPFAHRLLPGFYAPPVFVRSIFVVVLLLGVGLLTPAFAQSPDRDAGSDRDA